MMGDEPFDPEHLDASSFEIVRRGFDPTDVRAVLQRVSEEYRRLRVERDELVGRLAESEEDSDEQLEASRVAAVLGVEAAGVLEAAHVAASERADRADREAEAVRDEALAQADAMRNLAQEEADEIVAAARRAAEELVDEGRSRGRDMVTEAQTVRERMLGDLAQKRQAGRAQVEQLRAARDRLLESLTTVQGNLDTAVVDLVESVPDARAAAQRAGLRVTAEPEITTGQLEAEIEAARLVGHPLVDEIPGGPADSFDTGDLALTDVESALDEEAFDEVAASDDGDDEVDEPAVEADAHDEDADEPRAEDADEDADEPRAEDGDEDGGDALESADTDETITDEEPTSADESSDASDDGAELYDVEADLDEADLDEDAAAAEADDDDASGVDVLFAKLRESRSDGDDGPDADAADDDPRVAVRSDATAAAVKALKKVLVDEQGTLLDGIRRSGGEAVHGLVDDAKAHAAPYDAAARPALVAFAGHLGADAVDLDAALAQIHTIALDPVRQRLREAADDTDDADELSDTVRALYRESRSRRIPEAAAAAVVAADGLAIRASAEGSVRWVVEKGGPCGPDCADNELAGAVGPGEEFPTGDLHPPSHVACTCRLEPAD